MEICIYMALISICATFDKKAERLLEVSLRTAIFNHIYTYIYLYGRNLIDQMSNHVPQIRIWTQKMMVIPLEFLKQNPKSNERFIYHIKRYE